jgi:hypothetical protein
LIRAKIWNFCKCDPGKKNSRIDKSWIVICFIDSLFDYFYVTRNGRETKRRRLAQARNVDCISITY